jgi:hypothetical protein
MTARFICAAIVAAAALLCAAGVQAHEIGTTHVSVRFQSTQSYEIEVTTDAVSLVEKLMAMKGEPAVSSTDAADLKSELVKGDELFQRRLVAAFDGNAVRPVIDYAVRPPAETSLPPTAVITLTGAIPAGASHFSWSYSWTFATYALSVWRNDANVPATEWLEGGQASSSIALAEVVPRVDRRTTALRYLSLGFTHIVPHGFDHVLFVLGIFLLSRRMKQVMLQVSAFTIAHSITLALTIYGVVSVSPAVVEPLIAVSIAYVAIENILMSELKPWRVALVFAFGLLHGMGFAGALKELGLPRSEFITALVTFNVGVEAGQLAVIAGAFLLVGWYCSSREWYRRRIVLPASALIACTAVYWTIERLSF